MEIAAALPKRRTQVKVIPWVIAVLVGARHQRPKGLEQARAIIGEIEIGPHSAAIIGDYRDQVRGAHEFDGVFLCGDERPQLVRRRHRDQVEEQDEQTPIVVAGVARHWSRDSPDRCRRDHRLRSLVWSFKGSIRRRRESLKLDERHLLRFSIFRYGEILSLQAFDSAATRTPTEAECRAGLSTAATPGGSEITGGDTDNPRG